MNQLNIPRTCSPCAFDPFLWLLYLIVTLETYIEPTVFSVKAGAITSYYKIEKQI